ncbi:MAG TPA: 30S ribosomal protein S8 [Bacteroidota bacterium]|nr:30S ribosomal protein S8 [Bacteroidota bacterium]
MNTDPIADYLTRIRNAISARHKRVEIPASGMKRSITKMLADKRFISSYEEIKDNKQGILKIALRYTEGESAITGIERISTPGRRVYVNSGELPRVLNGMGIAIISTSRGLMTDKEAREQHVGGEVVCHVW